MAVRSATAAIAVLLCVAPVGAGQRFRSGVDAVRVDALVTDNGRPLTGLLASDFDLLDNGVPQQVEAATIGDVPLSVTIVPDVSGSVAGDTLQRLKEAAKAAIQSLTPHDRAALITFSDEVRLRTGWTSSTGPITGGIEALRAGGRTSLFDASYAALAIDDLPGRRRLILLFSDGADNASWLPRRAVALRAQETDAVVYAVMMNEQFVERAGTTLMYRSGVQLTDDGPVRIFTESFLDELTGTTGGRAFRSRGAGELRSAFEEIMREFRSRYVLTYMPRGVDTGAWHSIEVKLKTRRGTVKARRGYMRQ